MPKHRQPREIWQQTRIKVLERDGYRCMHCSCDVTIKTAHVDHIKSGKNSGNEMSNLRSLCYRCHVLRADNRHRGMTAAALRKGIIGPNWREEVWE